MEAEFALANCIVAQDSLRFLDVASTEYTEQVQGMLSITPPEMRDRVSAALENPVTDIVDEVRQFAEVYQLGEVPDGATGSYVLSGTGLMTTVYQWKDFLYVRNPIALPSALLLGLHATDAQATAFVNSLCGRFGGFNFVISECDMRPPPGFRGVTVSAKVRALINATPLVIQFDRVALAFCRNAEVLEVAEVFHAEQPTGTATHLIVYAHLFQPGTLSSYVYSAASHGARLIEIAQLTHQQYKTELFPLLQELADDSRRRRLGVVIGVHLMAVAVDFVRVQEAVRRIEHRAMDLANLVPVTPDTPTPRVFDRPLQYDSRVDVAFRLSKSQFMANLYHTPTKEFIMMMIYKGLVLHQYVTQTWALHPDIRRGRIDVVVKVSARGLESLSELPAEQLVILDFRPEEARVTFDWSEFDPSAVPKVQDAVLLRRLIPLATDRAQVESVERRWNAMIPAWARGANIVTRLHSAATTYRRVGSALNPALFAPNPSALVKLGL